MLTPEKVTFTQIAKHPLVYALVILAILVGFFVHVFTDTSAQRIKDCNEQVIYLRAEATRERELNQNLQMELLIKNNIISSVPGIVDSLAKQKKKK